MLNKPWFTSLLLFVLILCLNLWCFQYYHQSLYQKRASQSAEFVAQLSLPYLLEKDYLTLQSELNQLLGIEGMLSVSVVGKNYEAIAKAQHIALIDADTQYFSRPIVFEALDAADSDIGYAQVAIDDSYKWSYYFIIVLLAVVISLAVEGLIWLRNHQNRESNIQQLLALKEQLNLWVPKFVNSGKSIDQRSADDSCYLLIHFHQLISWQQRIQPQLAKQILHQFEQLCYRQLAIYGGTVIGNLFDGSQIIYFEGAQAQQRCFSFSSGLVYVLAASIYQLPLPLSAMLLPEPPTELSKYSLLSLPNYQKLFGGYCQQLEQLQDKSDANHLVLNHRYQPLFKRHASFSDTPIADLSLVLPSDAILKLWQRQIDKLQQDSAIASL